MSGESRGGSRTAAMVKVIVPSRAGLTQGQIEVWQKVMHPALLAHVGLLLPIYRAASAEGRAQLLMHNPVFASVLALVGE